MTSKMSLLSGDPSRVAFSLARMHITPIEDSLRTQLVMPSNASPEHLLDRAAAGLSPRLAGERGLGGGQQARSFVTSITHRG